MQDMLQPAGLDTADRDEEEDLRRGQPVVDRERYRRIRAHETKYAIDLVARIRALAGSGVGV